MAGDFKPKRVLNGKLKILLVTNGMILFAAAMLGPIYALFVDKIGGDLLDASLAGATFSVTAGIAVFLSGKLSDRVKENELIVMTGYLFMGFGFFLYTQIDSMVQLLFVQVIIGLGEALYSPSFDALYSKYLDGDRSGSQWGTWESMNYFSAAAGAVSGGIVVSFLSFDALFLGMSVLAIGSALYIYHLPRTTL